MGDTIVKHGIDDKLLADTQLYDKVAGADFNGVFDLGPQMPDMPVELGELYYRRGIRHGGVLKLPTYDKDTGLVISLTVSKDNIPIATYEISELAHASGVLALQLGGSKFDDKDPLSTRHVAVESVTGEETRVFYLTNGPDGDPTTQRIDFNTMPNFGGIFDSALKKAEVKGTVNAIGWPTHTAEATKDDPNIKNRVKRAQRARGVAALYAKGAHAITIDIDETLDPGYYMPGNSHFGQQPLSYTRAQDPLEAQKHRARADAYEREAKLTVPHFHIPNHLPGSRWVMHANKIVPGTQMTMPGIVAGHELQVVHPNGTPRRMPLANDMPYAAMRRVRPGAPAGTMYETYLPFDSQKALRARQGNMDLNDPEVLAECFQTVRTTDLAHSTGKRVLELMQERDNFDLWAYRKLTYVVTETNKRDGFKKIIGTMVLDDRPDGYFTFNDKGLNFRNKGDKRSDDVMRFSLQPTKVDGMLGIHFTGKAALFMAVCENANIARGITVTGRAPSVNA